MNWYNEKYSAYFNAPDADYPLGSAVNSTSEDKLDGTPYLAAFFNDVIGSMQAVIFGAFGKSYVVSGKPDSCGKSDVWDAIQKYVGDGDKTVKDALDAAIASINAKIPAQASATNQLADKSFVNSSIATNTAYFVGTFNSVAALNAYTGAKTNNDYAFVQSTDSAGNTVFSRYKWDGSAWKYEYELNNSSFTSSQWSAINSGATSDKIGQIKQMTGASAGANGAAGFVPAPTAGQQGHVLHGDGTWKSLGSSITLQQAFDAAHPVGDTYTQYPQQDDPATLYNKNGIQSTWSVVNYDGAFFRAQGGNAATYIDKAGILSKQNEGLPNVTGSITATNGSAGQGGGLGGGTVTILNSGALKGYLMSRQRTGGSDYGNVLNSIGFDASASNPIYGSSQHVTPENYTIRVWKRTA